MARYMHCLSPFIVVVAVILLTHSINPVHAFCGPSLSKTVSTSQLQAFSADNSRRRRPKKTLADRTPEEAVSLVQDVIQSALQAGPRAGPRRTLQAYQAISSTAREFLPQILSQSSSSPSDFLPPILRTLFDRLGATYIKLGQFIASSPTLFPAEYVQEFQKCLDQTEPLPWSTMKSILEKELGPGKSIAQVFSYVDPKPLASASIAQVHAATLKTGEQVVLKLQKPGIADVLQADLGFLYVSSRLLEFVQPDWERTSLSAVMGDLRASMLDELNFEQEAKNTIEFRRYLQDSGLLKQATAPLVYSEFTTKRLLVLERLDGVSLLDPETIAQVSQDPAVGTTAILNALNIWSMSVTSMPWFHADVHAGNLLLLKDKRVGFIDFGIVGRISPEVLNAVTELSAALAVQDSRAMAAALCQMGATEKDVDLDAFGRDIAAVLERLNSVQTDVMIATDGQQVVGQVSVDETDITNLLLEFVEVTENNGLKLPREFGLLVKQSLYFDRYLQILAPQVDVLNDDRVMIGGQMRETEVNGSDSKDTIIDV